MALVSSIELVTREKVSLHEPAHCLGSVVTCEGEVRIQLDTVGRAVRTIPGKVSQTMQFDREGFRQLLELGHRAFPDL